jgi:hypothetical protein
MIENIKIQNIVDYIEVSKLIKLGQQCTKKIH